MYEEGGIWIAVFCECSVGENSNSSCSNSQQVPSSLRIWNGKWKVEMWNEKGEGIALIRGNLKGLWWLSFYKLLGCYVKITIRKIRWKLSAFIWLDQRKTDGWLALPFHTLQPHYW